MVRLHSTIACRHSQERVGQTEKEKSQLLMQQALITQFMQSGAPGEASDGSICSVEWLTFKLMRNGTLQGQCMSSHEVGAGISHLASDVHLLLQRLSQMARHQDRRTACCQQLCCRSTCCTSRRRRRHQPSPTRRWRSPLRISRRGCSSYRRPLASVLQSGRCLRSASAPASCRFVQPGGECVYM